MQAVEEGYCDDLIFVPCAINYDRVLEEGAYLKEVKGSSKKKEKPCPVGARPWSLEETLR